MVVSRLAAATVLVALASSSATAGTLYSNPYDFAGHGDCSYNTTCGASFHYDAFAAQGFTLSTEALVTSASLVELDLGSIGPSAVNWRFYTSNSGRVGQLVISGTSSITSKSQLGSVSGYLVNDYTFDVPSVELAASDYFFALQVVSTNYNNYLGENLSGRAYYTRNGGATWSQAALTFSVSLFGSAVEPPPPVPTDVPEPMSALLLGMAAFTVAGVQRRRRT